MPMNTDIRPLLQHFFQVNDLKDVDVLQLEQFAARYPYFAPLQYLLAKKYKQQQHDAYGLQIAKTAIFFSNPHWLNDLILSDLDQSAAECADNSTSAGLSAQSTDTETFAEDIQPDTIQEPELTLTDESIKDSGNTQLEASYELAGEEPFDGEPTPQPIEPVVLQEAQESADLNSDNPSTGELISADAVTVDVKENIETSLSGSEAEPPVEAFRPDDQAVVEMESQRLENEEVSESKEECFEASPTEEFQSVEPYPQEVGAPSLQETEQPAYQDTGSLSANEPVSSKPGTDDLPGSSNMPVSDTESEQPVGEGWADDQYTLKKEPDTHEQLATPTMVSDSSVTKAEMPETEKEPDIAAELRQPGVVRQSEKSEIDVAKEDTGSSLPLVPIEPYYTVDYFASQGIKLNVEEGKDKLSQKLRSFTEWLKTMKRIHPEKLEQEMDSRSSTVIQHIAEHSNEVEDVVTEAMAEVYARQGLRNKAAEVYQKLSLLNPDKRAYFAARIFKLNEI